MLRQSFLNTLCAYAYITLRGLSRAVLKQMLHKHNIITVIFINFRRKKFAERMSRNIFIFAEIAYLLKLLLNRTNRDRENKLICADIIFKAVQFHILIDIQRNSEISGLAGLLFNDIQIVSVTVFLKIRKFKLHDIGNSDSKVRFQNQSCRNSVIWAKTRESFAHCCNDFFKLLLCQSYSLTVQCTYTFLSPGKFQLNQKVRVFFNFNSYFTTIREKSQKTRTNTEFYCSRLFIQIRTFRTKIVVHYHHLYHY